MDAAICRTRTLATLLLTLIVLFALSVPTVVAQSPPAGPQTYTVVAGDTLSRIAARYGVTVQELAAANNITDPSRIRVGQVLVIPSGETPAPPTRLPMPPLSQLTPARVTSVVDGDTIKVSVGGGVQTVRYIGIDTPETVHPSKPVQWMGPEASAANKALVEGQTVYLEKDVSETDHYGRLLRYVWLADGRMVNEELCRMGFAQSSSYPPDIKYQDRFVAAVQEAREAGRGLWGPAPESTTSATGRSVSVPTPTPPSSYVVKAGDNLSAIARTLGCDLYALCAYNEIADPSRINVGQVIQVPPPGYVAPTWTPAPPTPTPIIVAATATPAPAPVYVAPTPAPARTCCRVCTTGKACGNSCIARNRTCRQPPGCACNAY